MTAGRPQRTPQQVAYAKKRMEQLERLASRTLSVGVPGMILAIVLLVNSHFRHDSIGFWIAIPILVVGGALSFIGCAALMVHSMYDQYLKGPPKNPPPDPFEWMYRGGSSVSGMGAQEMTNRAYPPPQRPPNN